VKTWLSQLLHCSSGSWQHSTDLVFVAWTLAAQHWPGSHGMDPGSILSTFPTSGWSERRSLPWCTVPADQVHRSCCHRCCPETAVSHQRCCSCSCCSEISSSSTTTHNGNDKHYTSALSAQKSLLLRLRNSRTFLKTFQHQHLYFQGLVSTFHGNVICDVQFLVVLINTGNAVLHNTQSLLTHTK